FSGTLKFGEFVLPNAVVIRIFTFLDAPSLLRTGGVSKAWRALSGTEEIWRGLSCRRWPRVAFLSCKPLFRNFWNTIYGHRSSSCFFFFFFFFFECVGGRDPLPPPPPRKKKKKKTALFREAPDPRGIDRLLRRERQSVHGAGDPRGAARLLLVAATATAAAAAT